MVSAESVGERIRLIRQWRGVSLRRVAQELGVSPSLISQIETGKSLPSVQTLTQLAALFGVSTDDLLGITDRVRTTVAYVPAEPTPEVQRAEDNPVIEILDGVRWERLASSPSRRVETILVTYAPGASSSSDGRLVRHGGSQHALILEGELTLQLEFEQHVLRAGDSLQFESTRPHRFVNHTDAEAKGVWFLLDHRVGVVETELAGLAGPWSLAARAAAVDVLRRADQDD
jgi:Predicted transcriptional regulators